MEQFAKNLWQVQCYINEETGDLVWVLLIFLTDLVT